MKSPLLFSLAFLLAACGASSKHHTPSIEKLALVRADGLISINRPAPEVKEASPRTLLGFAPSQDQTQGKWISINRTEKTITLMDGAKVLEKASAEGIEPLNPGRYNLLHKQRAPLWYANDSYFSKRNLPVPPEGDKVRFRRGALGEFALFVDKDTPIHAGPIWSEDVGGVRLTDDLMKKFYYSVDIGSLVSIE